MSGASRPTITVVSYLANNPYSPRGIRTRMLSSALAREWEVELVAPAPGSTEVPRAGLITPRYPRVVRAAVQRTLLEKEELWSIRRLLFWRPTCAGALLVASPFAPVVYAARRLAAAGIPYVVDVGDPWVLTEQESFALGPALRRSKRAERRLWSSAAAVVVTTSGQAEALVELGFLPRQSMLVRPNGFDPAGRKAFDRAFENAPARVPGVLRLAHFGTIYNLRLDIRPLVARLVESGLWSRIEFHQYGSDFLGLLRELQGVDVVFHDRRSWPEIVALSSQYDAAVVVGNEDPEQLPSKVIDYLLLPIPRLALSGHDDDAVSRYLADKPGWLTIRPDTVDAAEQLRQHVTRRWTAADLAPPRSEEWPAVAEQVAQFVSAALRPRTS